MTSALPELQQSCQQRVDTLLMPYLKEISHAPILQEAMAYSVFNGGKRLRSLLIYATGTALEASLEDLDLPAAAIELMHSYSLIHDDLPAMDNADLRRGKPTCHKMYGDAVAILAGDSLQTLAFEILTSHPGTLSAKERLSMIQVLCKASGIEGMAAGQTLDILGVRSLNALTQMYQLKTGALLAACTQLGMIAAHTSDPAILIALQNFAYSIGLAYQLQDDLLDIEGNTATIGKTQGLDIANQKITYISLTSIQQTKQTIKELFESANAAIQSIGGNTEALTAFTEALKMRKN